MINNDKNLTLSYFVEYTNEVERDQDFENIKQLPNVKTLEDAINRMLLLRKQEKYNIWRLELGRLKNYYTRG